MKTDQNVATKKTDKNDNKGKEEGDKDKTAPLKLGGESLLDAEPSDVHLSLEPFDYQAPPPAGKSELFAALSKRLREKKNKEGDFKDLRQDIDNFRELLKKNRITGKNLLSKLREIKGHSYLFAGERISEGLVDDLITLLSPQGPPPAKSAVGKPLLLPPMPAWQDIKEASLKARDEAKLPDLQRRFDAARTAWLELVLSVGGLLPVDTVTEDELATCLKEGKVDELEGKYNKMFSSYEKASKDKSAPVTSSTEFASLSALLEERDKKLAVLLEERDKKLRQEQEERYVKLETELKVRGKAKVGSQTDTQVWTAFGDQRCETLESFFKGVLDPDNNKAMPDELLDWERLDGKEVSVRQPLFMKAIFKAQHGVAYTGLNAPKFVTLRAGEAKQERVLVNTNGNNWCAGRCPDYGLFAAGYAHNTCFGALALGEMDAVQSTYNLSGLHNGKLLNYSAGLIFDTVFRERSGTRCFGFLTSGMQFRFASQRCVDGETLETRATAQFDAKAAWPYLWALLNADTRLLGWSLPSVCDSGKELKLESCLGQGSFGTAYADSLNRAVKVCHEQSDEKKAMAAAAVLENEARMLTAFHATQSVTPLAAPTLTVNGAPLPAPADSKAVKLRDSWSQKQENEQLAKLLGTDPAGLESKLAAVPRVLARGEQVLQMDECYEPFAQRNGADINFHSITSANILQGLAAFFRCNSRGITHGEVAPRHLGLTASKCLALFDWGLGRLAGASEGIYFSGGHLFASNRLLQLKIETDRKASSAAPAMPTTCDDVESFIKTIYVLLHPEVYDDLLGVGITVKGEYDWPAVLAFWEEHIKQNAFFKRLQAAAVALNWEVLFTELQWWGCASVKASAVQDQDVYIIENSGKSYHVRKDNGKCRLGGATLVAVSKVEAVRRGRKPCGHCCAR